MSHKPDARERMIQSALGLFHQNGVNGTSIDQILDKSKTGKSQFSHYFKNKDGVIRAVLQYLHTLIREGHAPTGYSIQSWKDMETWFEKYINFQQGVDCQLSCPIGTIAGELSNEQELVRQEVKIFLEWSRGQLARFFAERKAAGEMSKSTNPDELADFCLVVMQGGMLLSKIKRDTSVFKNAGKQAIAHINSLRIKK